jgi:hypothetical protein
MRTSHDLMRKAMGDHGITAGELVDHVHRMGADRERAIAMVRRFVDGGPSTMGIAMAIIGMSVEHHQAPKH